MSNFSEQLKVALEAAELTQGDIGRETEISQSTISRYLRGEIAPEPEVFGLLLDHLPETLHFDLIVARLADELPKKYRSAVTILAQGSGGRKGQTPYLPGNLASDLRYALEFLADESVRVPEVRDLVLKLAIALGVQSGNQDIAAIATQQSLDDLSRRDADAKAKGRTTSSGGKPPPTPRGQKPTEPK